MVLFPAIDIKNGQCVRLFQGDFNRSKTYNKDPLDQAKYFEDIGFEWIHIVDLDGAKEGQLINSEFIERILHKTKLKVQLGGGIRDLKTVTYWIKLGVERVVLGTMAVKNPDETKKALEQYPDRLVLGLDTKDDYIAVEGWKEKTKLKISDLVKEYKDYKVASIVYTDISRDGALIGPNIQSAINLSQSIPFPVVISGGVSCFEDLMKIKNLGAQGISGVICGRAFYEKTIDPVMAARFYKSK